MHACTTVSVEDKGAHMESMEGDQENGGSAAARRVEIDTSSPFRSVKEAIMLFGERVLVGEIYANRINEVHDLFLSLSSCLYTMRLGLRLEYH